MPLHCCIACQRRCQICSGVHFLPCFAGQGLKRLEYRTDEWDVAFTSYLDGLRKEKPVVVTGDMNCAREPIDIHNARNNLKSAGFTPEERESCQKVCLANTVSVHTQEHHSWLHRPLHNQVAVKCIVTYCTALCTGKDYRDGAVVPFE